MSHITYPKVGDKVSLAGSYEPRTVTTIIGSDFKLAQYILAPGRDGGVSSVGLHELRVSNDWRPEVRTLLHQLKLAGFSLRLIDNGGSEDECLSLKIGAKITANHIEEICACDECRITVTHPEILTPKGSLNQLGLYLVFGNSPGELVCDCHVNERLGVAIDKASAIWEGKDTPKTYLY
jgi:hypothetical protein